MKMLDLRDVRDVVVVGNRKNEIVFNFRRHFATQNWLEGQSSRKCKFRTSKYELAEKSSRIEARNLGKAVRYLDRDAELRLTS